MSFGVGVDDREWFHKPQSGGGRPAAGSAGAVVLVLLAVALLGWRVGLAQHLPGYRAGAIVRAGGVVTPSLYPANDQWAAWLAPETVCPGGERVDAQPRLEGTTMLCLINYARGRQGLPALVLTSVLDNASWAKAQDIVRCGRFEHTACGKAGNQDATDAGYVGAFGENLYAAEGAQTAPRVALDGWLNSPEHRENLFRPEWRTAGLAALHGATFDRFRNAVIWVSEFGDH